MKRILVFFATLGMMLLVSGCVKVQSHVTLNADGSGDIAYTFAMTKEVMDMMKSTPGSEADPFEKLRKEFTAEGFTVTDLKEKEQLGIIAKKHAKNTDELIKAMNSKAVDSQEEISKESNGVFGKVGNALIIEKGFFTTKYKLDANIDMASSKASTSSDSSSTMADSMASSMASSMAGSIVDFSFVLTLPTKPSKHNASTVSDNGRTLEWPLKIGEKNSLQAEMVVPNIMNIGIVGGLGILALFGIIFVLVRKNSKNVPAQELEAEPADGEVATAIEPDMISETAVADAPEIAEAAAVTAPGSTDEEKPKE